MFFKIDYLLTAKADGATPQDQRIADDRLPPKIISNWFKQSGEIVNNDSLVSYLNKTEKSDDQVRGQHWSALEEDYPADRWRQVVEGVTLAAEEHLHDLEDHMGYIHRMSAIKVQFLVLIE